MSRPKYPLRYLKVAEALARELDDLPNFGPNGNLTGMRKLYWRDENVKPVKCGRYVYNCASRPDIYDRADTR